MHFLIHNILRILVFLVRFSMLQIRKLGGGGGGKLGLSHPVPSFPRSERKGLGEIPGGGGGS